MNDSDWPRGRRVVRELTEYEDGTVEERTLYEKKKNYEAPAQPPWMTLGLLALGGIGVFLAFAYRDQLKGLLGKAAPAVVPVVAKAPVNAYHSYKSETPRPEVNVDEFVYPVSNSGRAIR